MKKTVSVFLTFLLLVLCVFPAFSVNKAAAETGASFGAYDHVFIIGVDGAGRFFRDVDTPEFDRIFADGAVTYGARAEIITTSAQNWGSILTGVSYLRHGMTNDSISENERDSGTKYPSIFAHARLAFPKAELASIVHWDPINYGLIENDIDVYKASKGNDDAVTDDIVAYFNKGNAPALFFCQLDDVDHAGHEYGSKAQEYFEAVAYADGQIGRIYDAIEQNGLMENGLFIVVSDHGHSIAGGHGAISSRETYVTLAAKGKTVVNGGAFDADTRNRDVSAIALYALGIELPDYMSARVPADLFEDTAGEKRNINSDFFDALFSAMLGVITKLLRVMDV